MRRIQYLALDNSACRHCFVCCWLSCWSVSFAAVEVFNSALVCSGQCKITCAQTLISLEILAGGERAIAAYIWSFAVSLLHANEWILHPPPVRVLLRRQISFGCGYAQSYLRIDVSVHITVNLKEEHNLLLPICDFMNFGFLHDTLKRKHMRINNWAME